MFGTLKKMHIHPDSPARYSLPLGDTEVPLNPLLGKKLRLHFSGNIHCAHCGALTKKSYNQGYCYNCFRRLAACDMCILKPEQCHYHHGTCREPEWGERHCMRPHIVYLANSSGLKVGITRQTQIPTRWLDQGAAQALPIFRVRSRYQSGLLESAFKAHVNDKTNWRKLLQGEPEALDLPAQRDALLQNCAEALAELTRRFGAESLQALPEETTRDFHYPVQAYPLKISAFNFDKTPLVEGVLQGIKGQYLIFDQGVLNVRKFGSYETALELS